MFNDWMTVLNDWMTVLNDFVERDDKCDWRLLVIGFMGSTGLIDSLVCGMLCMIYIHGFTLDGKNPWLVQHPPKTAARQTGECHCCAGTGSETAGASSRTGPSRS